MKVINFANRNEHTQQVSDVEKCISESKAKFNLILSEVVNSKDMEAHKAESMIFKRLLELGLLLLKLYFANHNQGDYGKTVETAQGQAKRGKTSEKTYFCILCISGGEKGISHGLPFHLSCGNEIKVVLTAKQDSS